MVLKVKENKERKRKCSVKWIADEQGCEKKHKRWSEELTSGTVKLMAILSRRGWSKASELVKEGLRWRSWSSRKAPPPGK